MFTQPLTMRYVTEPIWYLDSGCSRSMTGVKNYLHKYVEQPGPKFDDKQGTNFNANKEIVLIAPRRNDVYVLDMSILTKNGACFFAKASKSMLTRSMAAKLIAASTSECLFADFLSKIEPKRVNEALKHPRNKNDKLGTVIRNKARLVSQGFSQEEGINYDESFELVARMKAIRIFLAYAAYMNFICLQMDVKSVFLNGKLKE
ncbi:retrovirus-related pol polyprotein from transposon TNT 1-94 [Tanacetum coccineum]